MQTEMKENPEFFKAFPHLQGPLYRLVRPGAGADQYLDDMKTNELYEDIELRGDNFNANYF